ncbi:putative holin-like toxin [Bacillus salipaludis]
MSVYEALTLIVSFCTLTATIISVSQKK